VKTPRLSRNHELSHQEISTNDLAAVVDPKRLKSGGTRKVKGCENTTTEQEAMPGATDT
jgi:hypothetical protein